ncbi:MAG: hypothetical protein J7493_13885 [Porphyrobacter sp.]|nr:hypothetical protein [Porphyrobacter sp.]
MKFLSLLAFSGVLLAAPAAARVAHETALTYEGATMSVTYEPKTTMTLRQSGVGPRGPSGCFWRAEVQVERKFADASGRTIDALTRTVGEPMVAEGLQQGHCAYLERNQAAVLDPNSSKVRAHLAEAAASDEPRLQSEMASFAALDREASR